MSCSSHRMWLGLLCSLLFAPAVTSAQMESALLSGVTDPGVSGVGTVVVKQRPSVMRMTVQLTEKAESLKEALARLKDRTEAAVLQLEALGANKDSVKVQPVELASGKTRQQQQMEQVLRMRRMQGRRVPKGLEVPEVITVTANLTAEWPLDAKSSEETLAYTKDIQDRVTAADLAGMKDANDLTPEAEELDEEMQQMMESMSYGEQETPPGEPHFFFVATLTTKAREEAMAEAFARAKAQAEQLAKSAGIQLGSLASLKCFANQSEAADPGYYDDGSSYRIRMMLARQAQLSGEANAQDETLVQSPNLAMFRIAVIATFQLQP